MDASAFGQVCESLERALAATFRHDVIDAAAATPDATRALRTLLDGMRANQWGSGAARLDLAAAIDAFDRRVRSDGFHAIHDWDGKTERVNDDTIAMEVVNYALQHRAEGKPDRRVLAILLDYYFLYVLALLSLNLWLDEHADARLDRLDRLVNLLQGPNGSGQRFVSDAATLMLLSTSHYESDDGAYDRLLDRARTLGLAQQRRIAYVHAYCLGSHLRFGIESTYGQDFALMRDDNGVDYRWLSYALSVVMADYERRRADGDDTAGRRAAAEALVNGLSADPAAFLGDRPMSAFAPMAAEHAALRDALDARRLDLIDDFERFRPAEATYSPIALFFNFSQNVLKGIVVDAVMWGEPWPVSFNELLTSLPADPAAHERRLTLARTLMNYARERPDRIRGQLGPAIVYDARAGRRAFAATMRALKPPVPAGEG